MPLRTGLGSTSAVTDLSGSVIARPVAQAGPSAPPAGQTWKLYYHANGKPIAMRVLPPGNSTGTLYFLHSDHLGSTSAVTDPSGSVIARQWYHPYGSVRASTGALPTDITFTAQRSDATGLYFYNARYYSGVLGRFISADTIVPEPGNPQALNRYAYVFNNPLKYLDPSGHDPCGGPGVHVPDCGVEGWGLKPGKTKPAVNTKPAWKTYTGDPPYSRGYDPRSDSIPDWGVDQSEAWRQMRAGHVWSWLCSSGGWWGAGCPSPKQLAAWLLWQEGGLLYNSSVVAPEVNDWSNVAAGRQAMVGLMAYLFGDGNITAADLSVFTAFFNPNAGGAFTNSDWAEWMSSPPPPPEWFAEVDKYWDKGPYLHNGRRVDRWWTTIESNPCTECAVALSIDISPLYPNDFTRPRLIFGYRP
jgi:RHS repeat-associated protein